MLPEDDPEDDAIRRDYRPGPRARAEQAAARADARLAIFLESGAPYLVLDASHDLDEALQLLGLAESRQRP
ncbi:MAG TPA: hypothetical protein VGK16_02020 [Candidatus Limnocylindrales bacterium]|jgi:hypothetical protein